MWIKVSLNYQVRPISPFLRALLESFVPFCWLPLELGDRVNGGWTFPTRRSGRCSSPPSITRSFGSILQKGPFDSQWNLVIFYRNKLNGQNHKRHGNNLLDVWEIPALESHFFLKVRLCGILLGRFIPQIAIAIRVLTSNTGEADEPFWQIGRGTRVPLQGGVDVVPLQGAIVVCLGGGRWRPTLGEWTWCHCWVPSYGAIVVCYRWGGWRPTLGEWTGCHCRVPL